MWVVSILREFITNIVITIVSFIPELVRSSELLLFGQHQSLLERRHLRGDGSVERGGILHGGPEAFVACR